jgi:hypothetical protein
MCADTTIKKRTPTQVFARHLMELFHDTSANGSSFAATVSEHYEKSYEPHNRRVEWGNVADPILRMQRDYERVKKWLDDNFHNHFPFDIHESFIAAFPEERRFKLQMELAARQGLLVIRMPSGNMSDDGICLGRIAKETGEAIIAISKLFEDGLSIRANSKSAIRKKARVEIKEAIAALAAMDATLEMMESVETESDDLMATFKT